MRNMGEFPEGVNLFPAYSFLNVQMIDFTLIADVHEMCGVSPAQQC